ncbi:MAG: serine/threonine protein kinase, partial [Gemmataceae bacterium]|nr:serine/threonine protein kinase [Gemmataceae bacterium]
MIGARVGNWYVEKEIGRGPFGSVYAARGYDDPDRRAAVKVITDPAARDPAFLQRFSGEMLALQRLDHPNVARYYDSGTHSGLAYVAAELVAGTDAAKLLEQGRRPWREVLALAVQAARALKHGHNRNVLHRDLKPAHLMLTPDGTLKLLGFGFARVLPPPLAPTPVIGSAAYLPPETASGKPPTRRSDFYSLGGVLYTLLTGRPPFAAATVVELTHKQCYALPERPGMLVPDLPPELDEFVCTLLAKDPARRPGTAQAVLDELERVRGKLERKGERLDWPAKLKPDTAEMAALPPGLGGDGPAADETEAVGRPWLKRPWVVIPLFAAVVVAIAVSLAWPGKSADELWAAAAPLLNSDKPADWDRAWDEYLDPLSRKYPDRYADEVAAAKTKIRDRKELRRVLDEGARADPRSDAERGYVRGLRLAQAGETDAARRVWQAVATAFGPVGSEDRWVGLSKAGLAGLDRPPRPPHPPTDRTAVDAALAHAKAL